MTEKNKTTSFVFKLIKSEILYRLSGGYMVAVIKKFGRIKSTDNFSRARDRVRIPGLTAKVVEGVDRNYLSPESQECVNQSSLYILQFMYEKEDGKNMYVVAKSRYESVYMNEIVTQEFVDYLVNEMYEKSEIETLWYNNREIDAQIELVKEQLKALEEREANIDECPDCHEMIGDKRNPYSLCEYCVERFEREFLV